MAVRFFKRIVLVVMLVSGVSSLSFADFYVIPVNKKLKNVVTVAKSGGQFTDIQKAIDSITDASTFNPYTVFIAAGSYTISDTIELKSNVHLAGSGRDATLLIADISGGGQLLSMSGYTSVANLTLLHTGANSGNVAIFMSGSSISLDNVYASASGATSENIALYAFNAPSVKINNCKVYASNGNKAYSLQNFNSDVTVMQSELKSTNATSKNYTVYTTGEAKTYIKTSQLFSSSTTQGVAKSLVSDSITSYNGVMFSEIETGGEALNSGRNSCFYTMKSDEQGLVNTYRYATENCSTFGLKVPTVP